HHVDRVRTDVDRGQTHNKSVCRARAVVSIASRDRFTGLAASWAKLWKVRDTHPRLFKSRRLGHSCASGGRTRGRTGPSMGKTGTVAISLARGRAAWKRFTSG